MISVQVAYAKPKEQVVLTVNLPEIATVKEVIYISGMLEKFPEINLEKMPVGIFNKIVPLTTLIKEGDRIEIYRPLLLDPKQIRLLRAKKQILSS